MIRLPKLTLTLSLFSLFLLLLLQPLLAAFRNSPIKLPSPPLLSIPWLDYLNFLTFSITSSLLNLQALMDLMSFSLLIALNSPQ
jgi:hypothetical protein